MSNSYPQEISLAGSVKKQKSSNACVRRKGLEIQGKVLMKRLFTVDATKKQAHAKIRIHKFQRK